MHSLYAVYHFPVKTVAGLNRGKGGGSHMHALIKISRQDKLLHVAHVHFLPKIMIIYVVNGQQFHNSFDRSKDLWK